MNTSSLSKSSSNNGKRDWMKILGIPVALIIFGLLMSMNTPVGMSFQGKTALATFLSALVLWVTQAIPTYATALLVVVVLAITGGWDQGSIFGVLGYDVIWLMLSAFIITSGMEKSGFAERLALFVVSKFGKTAKGALLSLMIVNFLLAFVIPSTTARAALLLPITMMICKIYNAVPGKSNFGRQVMLQEIHVNNIATSGILTATAAQIMAVGYIKDLAGIDVTWGKWFMAGMPIAILTMVASFVIAQFLYPLEVKKPNLSTGKDGQEKSLSEQYKDLGKMSKNEIKALIIFSITVLLWCTDGYHAQIFGVKISLAMVAVVSGVLFYMPYIGFLNWKETKIPWDLMIFSCGAYAGGLALDKSGVAAFLLNKVFGSFDLASMNPFILFMIVMFIASFSHMVFTSKTVRTVILIPTTITLAIAAGVNPLLFALPASLTICDSITLPPHCKPNLIFYSSNYFTISNQLVYGLLVLLAKWLIMGVCYFTWFRIIGLV
ncbi:DASS family sodium-coupled anion symporter [Clostridium tertium]|uniref:Malate transporter YflS n=1 Tax=Clostridium tertium TaxID=1559 RepID=A0A6N3E514_9CLOT